MIKYPLYVTLDTNIFVANKFDFSEDGTLGLLVKYVEDKKLKIVLSNIVIKEVETHVAAEGKKVCSALRNLRKEVLQTSSERYLEQVGLDVYLQVLDKEEYEGKSCDAWKEFRDRLKPEILDTSMIDLEAIIEDYFSFRHPFEKSDKKRKEFPDAFIANQIRKRFGKDQIVAIVSNDDGLKQACGNSENHIFYKTLGELYDAMSRQEAEYKEIVKNINSLVTSYILEIELLVKDNECVELHGLSYDRDGIVSGFDYSDFEVMSVKNINSCVRTIDEISEKTVRATLLCEAEINVECSYEDYDNAAWDQESKSYYFLETRKNFEKHLARFGIRIELDRNSNILSIMPFKVILNEDTLYEWFEIDEEDEYNSEMDIINQDRKKLGFCSLDQYSDYLEDNLAESQFMTSVTNIFEKINSLYQEYEEVATVYDEFITSIKESRAREVIKQLAISMDGNETFPEPTNLDKITDEEVDEVILWADQSYDRVAKLSEQKNLPDHFGYGETVEIYNGEESYEFVVGELLGTPSAGEEELIDLAVKDKTGNILAKGYVKLTVGYLDFDEDGGAGDGIEDDIDYDYEDVVNMLEIIEKSIGECVEKERTIAKKLEINNNMWDE